MHFNWSMWASIATGHQPYKINNFTTFKMGPVLTTEGELHQTKTYTCCRWCVEGNGAGAGASNNGRWMNESAEGWGSNNPTNSYMVSIHDLGYRWWSWILLSCILNLGFWSHLDHFIKKLYFRSINYLESQGIYLLTWFTKYFSV